MLWTEFTDVIYTMWHSVDVIMSVPIWGFYAYGVAFPVTGWFLFWALVLVMIFGWFVAFMLGGITMVVGADVVNGFRDYRQQKGMYNAKNSKGEYWRRKNGMSKPRYRPRGW